MALIALRQVGKTYGRRGKGQQLIEVLKNINLSVRKQEFIALMGPSGSGKTTLLNLIGGLDYPTEGTVSINETALNTFSAKALARWRADTIGFVFQFYNLLPVLTAEQNVALPLMLTKLGKRDRKQHAQNALDVVGLLDRAKHIPAKLSGGQQQRVAIARAIVADPEILVCDEPTGDLDRGTAAEILSLLQILNRDHDKTILMVTHDPKAAEYAQRIVYLDKGSLVSAAETPNNNTETT